MNIQPLWTMVDHYRAVADSLEEQIKVLTGDRPEATFGGDRIAAYTNLVRTLAEAAEVLHDLADRKGHVMSREHASKARTVAKRCTRALDELAKSREL